MTDSRREAARGKAAPALSMRSILGLWTMVVTVLVIGGELGASTAHIWGLWSRVILVAIIGFGVGLPMGSSRMRPRDRGVVGFAIGFIGTSCGWIISALGLAFLGPTYLEVFPALVAYAVGVLGTVAGGTCALGALVSGFLRGRLAEPFAAA